MTEAEDSPMTPTTSELLGSFWLLEENRVSQSPVTSRYCDQNGETQIVHNSTFQK